MHNFDYFYTSIIYFLKPSLKLVSSVSLSSSYYSTSVIVSNYDFLRYVIVTFSNLFISTRSILRRPPCSFSFKFWHRSYFREYFRTSGGGLAFWEPTQPILIYYKLSSNYRLREINLYYLHVGRIPSEIVWHFPYLTCFVQLERMDLQKDGRTFRLTC